MQVRDRSASLEQTLVSDYADGDQRRGLLGGFHSLSQSRRRALRRPPSRRPYRDRSIQCLVVVSRTACSAAVREVVGQKKTDAFRREGAERDLPTTDRVAPGSD